jgi:hypothetical protein
MRLHTQASILDYRTPLFIFLLSCIALFAGFYLNIYNTSLPKEMNSFGMISESLMMGRLAETHKNGLFSASGLLGFARQEGDTASDYKKQYRIYLEDLEYNSYYVYRTIGGFSGFVFGLIDEITGFSTHFNIKLFRFINSSLAAATLSFVFLFIFHYTGFLPWLLALLSVIFSIALTPFGSNLFYCFWAFYLPFLIVLYLLVQEDLNGRYSHKTALALIFAGMAVKGLFTSMEFITSILIMMMVPLFFFTVRNRWPVKLFLKRFLSYSLAALAGVVFTLLILSVQIAIYDGSANAGVNHIVKSWHKRTGGQHNSYEFDPFIEKSLKAKNSLVIKSQLEKEGIRIHNVFNQKGAQKAGWTLKYGYILASFGIASIFLLIFLKIRPSDPGRQINQAFILMTAISVLAPFSWFIIFKGHTWVHYNLVNLVWYFPFVILAAATVGLALKTISTTFFSRVFGKGSSDLSSG